MMNFLPFILMVDEHLALPPHGSEVFIGGLPRDACEDDLRELCEPIGEIFEVRTVYVFHCDIEDFGVWQVGEES